MPALGLTALNPAYPTAESPMVSKRTLLLLPEQQIAHSLLSK
jgi:hypothetical protein